MKRVSTATILIVLSFAALAQDEPKFTFERESVWRSRYVWRGLVLEPESVYETSTTFGFGSGWFNVWTINRGPETLGHRSAREVDFSLGWDLESGGWTFSPSFIYYSFPNGWEARGTGEIGLGASRDLGAGFSIRLNAFFDVASNRGASFLEFGLGFERELGRGWTLDASAIAGHGDRGFNAANYDLRKGAWNAACGEIGLSVPLNAGWSLRTSATHSRTLDRRLRNASDRPDNSVWSVSLTYSK